MQVQGDSRLRVDELATRLPEYGEEALSNLTEQDLYTLSQQVIVEQTARTCARMEDNEVTQEHRDRIRHTMFGRAAA